MIEDSSDILAGYALFQGRRTVYIPAVKRADASTVSVVDALEKAVPRMQAVLPKDVKISYEFDQSKYVREAIADVFHEGLLGTILPGLMILLFLRDIRSHSNCRHFDSTLFAYCHCRTFALRPNY